MSHVVALSGGVGGAKLALGLARVLPAGALTVIANTGDDFDHLGLRICPDIDTLTYTLAGLANTELGWGRAGETWHFMVALQALGGADWFRLGDADLALHVERTRRLLAGDTLSSITDDFAQRLGATARIVPMTEDRVSTQLATAGGWLDFQDYFVRLRCEPAVHQLRYRGAERAAPHPDAIAALGRDDLSAVIICPSNPYLSVDPILALPGLRSAILGCGAPVVAVSPIVGGQAIKGPTAKLMRELGTEPSVASVAHHYRDLVHVVVADVQDEPACADAPDASVPKLVFRHTVMQSIADRETLARDVLAAAQVRDFR